MQYTRLGNTGLIVSRMAFGSMTFGSGEGAFSSVYKLREIGANHNASPAQVALAWLLSRPFVTSILVGASKVSQLDENLGAAELKLSNDELATLDQLTKPRAIYPYWFNELIYDEQVRDVLTRRS